MAYSAVSTVQQGVNANEVGGRDQKTHKGPRRVASGKGMRATPSHSPMAPKTRKRSSVGKKRAAY